MKHAASGFLIALCLSAFQTKAADEVKVKPEGLSVDRNKTTVQFYVQVPSKTVYGFDAKRSEIPLTDDQGNDLVDATRRTMAADKLAHEKTGHTPKYWREGSRSTDGHMQ